MSVFKKIHQNNKLMPLVGLSLSAFFWMVDTLVDYLFFNEESESFLESMFEPEPMDFWMRWLVIGILLVFSLFAQKILLNEMHARLELEKLKTSLEQKVTERTLEIQNRNDELHKEIALRKQVEEELQLLAITDPLTGLYNRRMFHQLLSGEIDRDKRYRSGLGVIFCDLDHFKHINDHFGHDVGDEVLKVFADHTKKSLRDSDIVARWGGEEFIILIPQTNLEKTLAIANKLQRATEQIICPPLGRFTCSFGVTIFDAADTVETFIKRADDALYQAKNNGRNRVEKLLRET